MTAAHTSSQISRYALSDLAIRSAIALERYALGEPLEREPIETFANALSGTSRAERPEQQTRYFAVGYHASYMKLAGTKGVNQSVVAVQDLLEGKAASIKRFLTAPDKGAVKELAEFCADLHHELAQSQLADIRLAKRHRIRSEIKRLSPRLGEAANSCAS